MRTLTPLKNTPLSQRRTPRLPTDEEEFRETFFLRPVKALVENAISSGHLLDWMGTAVDLETPKPFHWPADEEGRPVDASDFNSAFQIYDFDLPVCACNTQDKSSDIATRQRLYSFNIFVCRNGASAYFGNVLLSCRMQRSGCDIFVILDKFTTQDNLVLQRYPLCTIPGKGLRNFDPTGILAASSPSPASSMHKRALDTTESPLARLKNASTPKGPLGSARSTQLRQGSSSSKRQRNTPFNTECKERRSGVIEGPMVQDISSDDDGDVFLSPRRQHQLAPQANRQRLSADSLLGIAPPPHYAATDPARPLSSPTRPIIDRYYGDTAPLFHLPKPEELLMRNRELSFLKGQALRDSLADLDSIRGIPSPQFWRTIDMCECERWFTRRALYEEHSQVCMHWTSDPAIHGLSPSSSSDVARLPVPPSSQQSAAPDDLGSPAQLEQVQPSPSPSVSRILSKSPRAYLRGRSQHSHLFHHAPYVKPLPVAVRHKGKEKERALDHGIIEKWPHSSLIPGNCPRSPPSHEEQHKQPDLPLSPYPIVPHPSPVSPPTRPTESIIDVQQDQTSSDNLSSISVGQESDELHTIQADVLNAFLDKIDFDVLNANNHT